MLESVMPEFWAQLAISNLCVSSALAAIAYVVHRRGRQPLLAHILWLLVLVKLVTPPILTVPIIPVGSGAVLDTATPHALPTDLAVTAPASTIPAGTTGTDTAGAWTTSNILVCGWALSSLLAAAWSLGRVGRFARLLVRATQPAPSEVLHLADGLSDRLGLRRTPRVLLSTARMSPFVWWTGGRPRVVLPEQVLEELSTDELTMVLAHELGHVCRRDHWVRWVEWLACVAFWWNPVTWWARRSLRISEELACDALVLDRLHPEPHNYANSLLNVAEFLSTEAVRPPAVASAMNRGGSLEQRLMMIISNRRPNTPRWLRSAVFALGLGTLPLSVAYAQNLSAIERRLGSAIEAGEISVEQAKVMLDALRRTKGRESRLAVRKADANKIKSAVRAGKLSAADARKKLEAQRRELLSNRGSGLEQRKRRIVALERELERAVKQGKLSKSDAQEKLIAARKQMFRNPSVRDGTTDRKKAPDASLDARKRRYMEFQREIEMAVKQGKLSRDAAQKKLIELRKKMFRKQPEDGRAVDLSRARNAEARQRIEDAFGRGDLSSVEAEQKLRALRGEKRNRRLEASKRQYDLAQRKLTNGVRQGKLSKQDAEQRLFELRKKLFGGTRDM